MEDSDLRNAIYRHVTTFNLNNDIHEFHNIFGKLFPYNKDLLEVLITKHKNNSNYFMKQDNNEIFEFSNIFSNFFPGSDESIKFILKFFFDNYSKYLIIIKNSNSSDEIRAEIINYNSNFLKYLINEYYICTKHYIKLNILYTNGFYDIFNKYFANNDDIINKLIKNLFDNCQAIIKKNKNIDKIIDTLYALTITDISLHINKF